MSARRRRDQRPDELPTATWFREKATGRWLLLVPESVAGGEPVMVEDRHGNRKPHVAGADVGVVFVATYGPNAGERVRLVEPVEPVESEAARKDAARDDPDCPDELLPRRCRRARGESQR